MGVLPRERADLPIKVLLKGRPAIGRYIFAVAATTSTRNGKACGETHRQGHHDGHYDGHGQGVGRVDVRPLLRGRQFGACNTRSQS